MGGSLIVNLILLGQCGLKAISFHHCWQPNPEIGKKEKVNGYKGGVKGEYNVKKSKTLKSKRRYKKRTTTIRIKKNFHFTDRNYDIASHSYGDQSDSESDDCERFSDFVTIITRI